MENPLGPNGFLAFYQAGLEKFSLIFCLESRKNLKVFTK